MKVICIAGKNNIAVDVLKYLIYNFKIQSDYKLVCILNNNEKDENTWQKSLKWHCQKYNIPIVSLEELYHIKNLIFLSLEFDQIIRPSKFKSTALYNIHFSLLPKYKGMYTSIFPILNDEKYTGVTLHKIREGIDTGEIIAQEKIKIDYDDSSYDVYCKLIKSGTNLVIKYLDRLINENITYKIQNKEYSTYYSKKSIDFKNLQINLKQTGHQIHNQVRAFAFRPYQLLKFKEYGIIEAQITDTMSSYSPGNIIKETEVYYLVSTIDYNVILYKDLLKELLMKIAIYDNKIAKKMCASSKIVNAQNENGWSPLMVAVYTNNLEMLYFLLSKGADITIKDYNGMNLLQYAKMCYEKYHDDNIFNILYDAGVSIYEEDYQGKSFVDYCIEEKILKIGNFIIS